MTKLTGNPDSGNPDFCVYLRNRNRNEKNAYIIKPELKYEKSDI